MAQATALLEIRRTPRSSSQAPRVAALVTAALGAALYLLLHPPSGGDLAAATYRATLFGNHPFGLFDLRWYAGHYLPAYSLFAPALGWLLGVRLSLAISALAAAPAFAILAEPLFPTRRGQAVAAAAFAFGFGFELWSGRQPFDLGLAFGLWAVALSWRLGRRGLGLVLALLCGLTSPVAGLFLALAAGTRLVAVEIRRGIRRAAREAALIIAALGPPALLVLLFGEGGYEPFAAAAFWPQLGASAALAVGLPALGIDRRLLAPLRLGLILYAILLLGSFLIPSPLGSNSLRLAALLGPPIVGGGLAGSRRWFALLLLAPALLYWQTAATINDQRSLQGNKATHERFFAPLRAELLKVTSGRPVRIEVPMLKSHWEAVALAKGPLLLARGWERQLDTRFDSLFYSRSLNPTVFHRWLSEWGITYLALPVAPLDSAGKLEARLLATDPPYLVPIWHNANWRLFAVRGSRGLVQPDGTVERVGAEGLKVALPAAGLYRLAFHYTPYWHASGGACPYRLPGDWLGLWVPRAETVEVTVSFSLSALFFGPGCRAGTALRHLR